jgi:hypothetical protein
MPKDVSNEYLAHPEVKAEPTLADWREIAAQAATPKARARVMRDFLEALPPERFDMSDWVVGAVQDDYIFPDTRVLEHQCGTAACIAGWVNFLTTPGKRRSFIDEAGHWLGLRPYQAHEMFLPNMFWARREELTTAHAIALLDHYIATGEVDWEVARYA